MTSAGGTGIYRRIRCAAVMAKQFIGQFVKSERQTW
jgi:hypothetical protein